MTRRDLIKALYIVISAALGKEFSKLRASPIILLIFQTPFLDGILTLTESQV